MTEPPRPALPLDIAESADAADVVPLSYATPDADGLPEFHPVAEQRIDDGAAPHALRDLFPSRQLAARYFGKSMARRLALDVAPARCCVCDAADADMIAVTRWTVSTTPRSFSTNNGETVGTIDACHPLCENCEAAWQKRQRGWRWVRWLGRILQVSLFVYVPLLLGLWIWGPKDSVRIGLVIAIGLTWLLTIVLNTSARLAIRHTTPKAVWRLRRKKFVLLGLIGTGRRKEIEAAMAAAEPGLDYKF